MKDTTTLTSLLGLTQKQMALLLQVNRSQWSMYESGQRGLPLESRQLLAEMIGFLKFENQGTKVLRLLREQEEDKKKQLEKQIRANEHQLYAIAKELELSEAKYTRNLTAVGFVDYISSLSNRPQPLDTELLEAITTDAECAIRKSGLARVTALQMQQEVLELEKLILGSALNKAVKTLEKLKEDGV
ncbi:hypothetical protein [Flavobacterium phycosphaerae]|uniref:hypothetical protein n=1 Tax=Flavobacterium phycosphaerae TaxID=2697515 RepID=UPI00138A28D2|nr:hypothetical protein [Flavobacterium phycosphaerae]